MPSDDAFSLTPEWLTSRCFAFRAGSRSVVHASSLGFERNGRISGYRHRNETAWRIEDGKVVVLDADGVPSCIAGPTRNDDGTVSLVGAFLLTDGDHTHRFDEVASPDGLPEVLTFDLFDTLVARRCYEPTAIFRRVEASSGVAAFARLRQAVEYELFQRGDYSFDDIYAALRAAAGWPDRTLSILKMLELAEEWDNLFPIQEMVARVGPRDMVVSDMYLPMSFLRRLVDEKCRLENRVIHLSCHGKRRGTVWLTIGATHRVRRHHGDNRRSDVERPRQSGIDTEHVAISAWSQGERILLDAGLEPFARVIREARLRSFHLDPRLRGAQLAQFEVNLPLLVLASLVVLRHARERGIDTLLMCSRDCNLWVELMRWMAVRSSASPVVRYFVASRVLFLSDSPEYAAYFLKMRGQRSMLVDVSGTGRSPSYFIGKVDAQRNTSVFLIAATREVAPWVAKLADPRDDVDVAILSDQPFHLRNPIEMLNMSLEGRATRISLANHDLAVESWPTEFGSIATHIITMMRDAFLTAMKILDESGIRQLPENISTERLRTAAEAVLGTAGDYRFAWGPINDDVRCAEGEIAEAAHAERQRNSGSVSD